MRLSYTLLAAAATLLATSEAVSSATATDHASLSKLSSANAVQAVEVTQTDGTSKRFLRVYHDEDDIDSDDLVVNDADEEERGKAPFATERLQKALNNNSKLSKLLKQWDNNGYTVAKVAEKLDVDVNGALDQKFMSLVTAFQSYKNGWRPQ
ncbi:hypothetical protein PHYPSEUDO_013019 [Phytophthora pseudosyringae]|uniref:RxLR effector protein n=1 Tax=Phytophthora pseudosyringae TaxID=221518 RepID=A0A8T1V6H9_9STRA|nr:hypothetical protein PHYPSEUDO_013018 [Phytophthora pseudosyringae]KAG7376632.1 hypothetical protein PHYPSEUDO_013019 [Phytophthora pseudosyringae]